MGKRMQMHSVCIPKEGFFFSSCKKTLTSVYTLNRISQAEICVNLIILGNVRHFTWHLIRGIF